MKNKKILIISSIICLVVILVVILVFILTKSKDNNELFSKDNLIKDSYITDDYINNSVYENIIYVPKFMTKTSERLTTSTYSFKNENYSLKLNYNSYLTEDDLKRFIDNETFNKKDFYYYINKGTDIKIYFKNEYDYYQTIEINIHSSNNTYIIDSSYKYLVDSLSTIKKSSKDYSINKEDGYYIGSINYNEYTDETNKLSIKTDYKVSMEKYGSNYDIDNISPSLLIETTNISFYEGEIKGDDITTINKQTLIRTYFSKINNLNIKDEAIRDLNYPMNQKAFKDVTEDMVKIELDTLKYNDKDVSYYKVVSDNNNAHNERIYAYLPLQNNIYYVVQIYGGETKNLDINMINDFLPTNIEIN